MPGQLEDLYTGGRVQHAAEVSVTGDGQPSAVGVKRHGVDFVGVLVQLGVFRTRGRIPEPHGAVAAGGSESPAVRAERHARDGVGVAVQDQDRIPGGHVPHLHDIIAGRGREPPAVWAECQTGDSLVIVKCLNLAPGVGVPDLGSIVAAGGEPSAVRAKCQANDRARLSAHVNDLFSGRGVKDPDRTTIDEREL